MNVDIVSRLLLQSKNSRLLYTAVDLMQCILIYFTDYTRFAALTNICVGIYFQNIIRLLAVVFYVACYQRWP